MKVLFIVKSLIQRAIKNKYSLLIYIMVPIIGVIIPILIYSNNDNDGFDIKIVDTNKSFASVTLIDTLIDKLDKCEEAIDIDKATENILNGRDDLLIIIPSDFKNMLLEDSKFEIDFIYMTECEEIYVAKQRVNEAIKNIKIILDIANGEESKFRNVYKSINKKNYNINTKIINEDNNILSISCLGFIILFMMIIINSSLSTILQDRNNSIQKRYLYMNINAKIYIFAQIIWSFLLSIIQCIIIILFIKMFNINLDIRYIFFFCILIITWFTSFSFAIFSISFCKSEEQLTIINTIIVFPTCMLSGCLWPVNIMDDSMQKLSLIFPQRHIILLLEQIQINENIYVIILNIIYIILVSSFLLTIGIIKIENNSFKEIV